MLLGEVRNEREQSGVVLQCCQWLLWCWLCEEQIDGFYEMAIQFGGFGHDGSEVRGRGVMDARYGGLKGGSEGSGGPVKASKLGTEAEEGGKMSY